MKSTSILFFSLVALLNTTILSARTAKILYFQAPKEAPENVFIYQNNQNPFKQNLPKNNFSSAIKLVEGDLDLQFLPSFLLEDEAFPENAPSVKIPAEWNKILILVSNDPTNALLPVKLRIINASKELVGNGDLIFLNLSTDTIKGTVGDKELELKPDTTEIIKDPIEPEAKQYMVELDRLDAEKELSLTFIRQLWRRSNSQSLLMLIYNHPVSKRISYYCAPIKNL